MLPYVRKGGYGIRPYGKKCLRDANDTGDGTLYHYRDTGTRPRYHCLLFLHPAC